MTVFETARLRIRHLLPSDAEALFAICRDPVTMQVYFTDRPGDILQ